MVPLTNGKEAAVHTKHRASQCLGDSEDVVKYSLDCSKRKGHGLMSLQKRP